MRAREKEPNGPRCPSYCRSRQASEQRDLLESLVLIQQAGMKKSQEALKSPQCKTLTKPV